MIRKLFSRAVELLKDPSRSFKERVFILLTLVTDFFVLLALICDIIFNENKVEIITLIVTVIMVPLITILSIRKNRVNIAVRIIVVSLIVILLPILFYYGGGVYGGGVIWIIFTYLYTGLVVSKKWKPFFLIVLTIETVGFYLDGYFWPHMVTENSTEVNYFDSMMSIILVGIICCLMVWFEEWLFTEENKRAKEETKKVEELNRSQNRFFSSMSHEIRTPINSWS